MVGSYNLFLHIYYINVTKIKKIGDDFREKRKGNSGCI